MNKSFSPYDIAHMLFLVFFRFHELYRLASSWVIIRTVRIVLLDSFIHVDFDSLFFGGKTPDILIPLKDNVNVNMGVFINHVDSCQRGG